MIRGIYDGVVTLNRDNFPEFAASLLIREAGGVFYTVAGEERIKSTDHFFVGGSEAVCKKLKSKIGRLFECI
jgi:fructose-1,6-bisphosphatase/inositol monophosphatase family enzyme